MLDLDLDIYVAGLAAAMGMAIVTWLFSIPLRDVSIADPAWPPLFILMAVIYILMAPEVGTRSYLVFFLVTLWASRLSSFVLRRNWRMPEDRRYQRIRHANAPRFWMKSLYIVFGMQAVLAWIISLPLLGAMLSSSPLGWLSLAGTGACTIGIATPKSLRVSRMSRMSCISSDEDYNNTRLSRWISTGSSRYPRISMKRQLGWPLIRAVSKAS